MRAEVEVVTYLLVSLNKASSNAKFR